MRDQNTAPSRSPAVAPANASAARRSDLAKLIEDACSRRGDSQAHRRACIHDTIREPQADWPWWIAYWEGVKARGRAGDA
mgnify:CR=1 FL=1